MRVVGISPLDKDATASIVDDGRILFAAGEERFSRVKQHAGFPGEALTTALEATGTRLQDIDAVAYPFLDAAHEARLMQDCIASEARRLADVRPSDLHGDLLRAATRIPTREATIHGLKQPNQAMAKGALKQWIYKLAAESPRVSRAVTRSAGRRWARTAVAGHRRHQDELHAQLKRLGLLDKLRRYEHHLSHAAGAYLSSGFDRALVVTLDGYGSGLAGSVSLGEGGQLKRLHNLRFPHSLGTLYETVTSSLGFHPDRHAGKVVGLAAYGDPEVLSDVLAARMETAGGDLTIDQNLNVYFSRHLAAHFPMIDVAAAYQHVLELVAGAIVSHWMAQTGADALVLAGGVAANVKMNQRLFALPSVKRIFIDPNMGDGGCGTGLGLFLGREGEPVGERLHDAYLGPEFTDDEIAAELQRMGLAFTAPSHLAAEVARHIHAGEVIGRFSGRMEYGPRALGHRSILYHAREPEVNQWLNGRLGRTEFMPFAPVTLYEEAGRCYHGLAGAEHAAEFMTITFDCTDWMKSMCPAAVHVDGTARPQLIRREVDAEYHAIVEEYGKLSGVPCLINTSFNMHEEPIVCTPHDAVRAFLDGRLDGLAIGSFFVPAPKRDEQRRAESPGARAPQPA